MDNITQKIDLFMKLHVLPTFDPNNINWVFSLSGGKDSYVMCNGIKQWYEFNSFSFHAIGIHIWQWGDDNPRDFLNESLPWLDIRILDARSETSALFLSTPTSQAPCRQCSDIRHRYSDIFLENRKTNQVLFLCRGLHMTDMAISILWRLVWYGPLFSLQNKGKPLVALTNNSYLAKPLCYAREFETQLYAEQHNYTAFHSECPVRRFPSRRDIVEESIKLFYSSSQWEFDVPGVDSYLQNLTQLTDVAYLRSISLHGMESKEPTIPNAYFDFAKAYFLQKPIAKEYSRVSLLLEDGVNAFLSSGRETHRLDRKYCCKLIQNPESLSPFDLRMIGTLGPFWAAFSLPKKQKEYFYKLQMQIWDFSLDIKWGQVYSLMNSYYLNI